ncbi:hypothetical protein SLEP1_g50248 [Rubroshorea leprosula]|uniref:Uncharacterized protein n=1 Tax=Rubroshorea leprosula TaxID=152421 RepID=A0AAV5LZM5_9ROSI|nr:hypothetical protein SLEP1_g50248 [Rubroshorea leprosula]
MGRNIPPRLVYMTRILTGPAGMGEIAIPSSGASPPTTGFLLVSHEHPPWLFIAVGDLQFLPLDSDGCDEPSLLDLVGTQPAGSHRNPALLGLGRPSLAGFGETQPSWVRQNPDLLGSMEPSKVGSRRTQLG